MYRPNSKLLIEDFDDNNDLAADDVDVKIGRIWEGSCGLYRNIPQLSKVAYRGRKQSIENCQSDCSLWTFQVKVHKMCIKTR